MLGRSGDPRNLLLKLERPERLIKKEGREERKGVVVAGARIRNPSCQGAEAAEGTC